MSAQTYHLPDLLSLLPERSGEEVNPHLKEADAAFNVWVRSTPLTADYTKLAEECDAPLFTAMLWPRCSYEWLTGLVNWNAAGFLIDDMVDRCRKEQAPGLAHSWVDSLRDGKSIQHPLMAVIQNDLLPSMRTAIGPFHWPRFVAENERWLFASVQETHGQETSRDENATSDIQSYLKLRREAVAAFVCLTMTRSSHHLDIPDDVLANPVVHEMQIAMADVMMITNDIHSFMKEYKRDQAFSNILTVIRKSKDTAHLDLQGALDYSGKLVEESVKRFHACKRDLPSFGPEMDAHLAAYAEAIVDTAVGNVKWHRVSRRYNTFANDEDRKNNIVRWSL